MSKASKVSAAGSGDAAVCAHRIREIYEADLTEDAGVLHVLAAWQPPPVEGRTSALIALTTGAAMPRSHTDPFLLRVARARADAIITTGRNLRVEPALTHSLESQRADTAMVTAWRCEVLGKAGPPISVVLTRGAGLDLDHPVFRNENRRVIFTSSAAARSLRTAAAATGVEVVGVDRPDIRAAIDWLREESAAKTLCVEAGPSTAAELYRQPAAVDELMLSLYEGSHLDEAGRGPAFLDRDTITRALPETLSRSRVEEPSGPWSYLRLRDVAFTAGSRRADGPAARA